MNAFFSRLVLGCLIAVLCVSTSLAAGKKNKNKGQKDPAERIKKKLTAADLPSETLAKANKIIDENAPRLKAAQAKVDSVLTSEQKQARRQALKDAKTSGKKRKQAQAEVLAAMKLTDDQKTKLAAAESDRKSAQSALTRDLRGVLTQEQLAKVGLKTKKKKA